MSYRTGPKIVTDGLVLCLDAADRNSYPGSGTTWKDLTTINSDGTLVNGPVFDSANNGIMSLDGVNDYISIPDNDSLDIVAQISLEAWIYPIKNTGTQNVICKSSGGQNTGYIYPRTDNGWSQVVFYLRFASWSTLNTTWPSRNAWHHTIATYDNANMKIYIDGNIAASKAQTGNLYYTNNNNLTLGNQPGFSEYYGGKLGLAKVYNRALSASEVQQNYNATKGRFGL